MTASDEVDLVAVGTSMVISTQAAPDGTDPALVALHESVLAQLHEVPRASHSLRMLRLVDTYV